MKLILKKRMSLILLGVSIFALILTYVKQESEKSESEKKEIQSNKERERIRIDLDNANEHIKLLLKENRRLSEQLDKIHSPRLSVYKMTPNFGEIRLDFDNVGEKSATYINFQYKAKIIFYNNGEIIKELDENKFYYYYHSSHPNPKYINPNDKFHLMMGIPEFNNLVKDIDYDKIEVDFYLIRLRTKFFQSNDEKLKLVINEKERHRDFKIEGTTFFRLKIK